MPADAFLPPFFIAVAAVIHVLLGPDHYLPIAALSYEFGFTRRKTLILTILLGVLHCFIALALAMGLFWFHDVIDLAALDQKRASVAGGILFLAAIWSLWGWRRKAAVWRSEMISGSAIKKFRHSAFIWLGAFFIIGPCEPLTALWATAEGTGMNGFSLVINTVVFIAATIGTMMLCVEGSLLGLTRMVGTKSDPSRFVLPLSWGVCAFVLLLGW